MVRYRDFRPFRGILRDASQFGFLAQLGERYPYKVDVTDSSPVESTMEGYSSPAEETSLEN